jgi:hypothetical protein
MEVIYGIICGYIGAVVAPACGPFAILCGLAVAAACSYALTRIIEKNKELDQDAFNRAMYELNCPCATWCS